MTELDILDAIDRATGCHQCEQPLGDSVSDLFCSQDCQENWHDQRTMPLDHYEEPTDLPVHIYNQVELESPETSPAREHLTDGLSTLGEFLAHILASGETERLIVREPLTITVTADFSRLNAAFERASRALARFAERMGEVAVPFSIGRGNGVLQRDGGVPYHFVVDEVHAFTTAKDRANPVVIGQLLHGRATGAVTADMITQVRDAWQPPQSKVPDAVRARALELVRTRNTGPTIRQRPPRVLGPRAQSGRRW